ncbi:MAG: YdaS family helix-turn-helix protein [Victivallaceae bacterium]|nr:YdaS family helix-turn-helix protein [Victivallaceae bacterium]
MKITEEVKAAIRKAVEQAGTQQKFADLCGITQRNISKYLSGEVKSIRDDCQEKLYPFIREYLPVEYLRQPAASESSCVSDAELEILKRDAKIAQYLLHIAYLERKVKRLQELNGFR